MRKLIDRIPGNGMRRTIALILTIIITFTTTYSLVLPAITLEKDTAETMSGISMRENGQRGDISASSEEEIESASGTETGSTDPVAFDAEAKDEDSETVTLVHVEADAGAFPEGTTMEASAVTDQNVIDSITGSAEGEVVAVHAVDLTFKDENGETVQPADDRQVSVALSVAEGEFSDAEKDETAHNVQDLTSGESASEPIAQTEDGSREGAGQEENAEEQTTETAVVRYTEDKGTEVVEATDEVSFQVEPENGLDQENAVSFDMSEQAGDEDTQTYAIVETAAENDETETDAPADAAPGEAFGGSSGTEETVPVKQELPPEGFMDEAGESVLTAQDDSYYISVTYGPEAKIPQGASLKAEEILTEDRNYDTHLEETRKVLNEAAQAEAMTEDGVYAGPEADNKPQFFGARSLMADLEAFDRQQAMAAAAPEPEIVYARFFDIAIVDDGGNEVTPKAPVKVSIELLDTENNEQVIQDADAARVVHFGEEETEIVEAEALEDTVAGVAFDAEGFSVYGVVYTVDFHSGEYTYSLSGGGSVTLRELFEYLGIEIDANNVENAVFSDPALVWVGKAEKKTTVGALKEDSGAEAEYSAELTEEQIAEINARTVEAGEWVLISIQPFDSEEELTVTMTDGEVLTIRLTDAQITRNYITASGEAYTITVTYGDDTGIPENADLEVEELLPDTMNRAEEYAEYVSKTENALGMEEGTAGDIRLFDISIVDQDDHGIKYQPAEGSRVAVRIELTDRSSEQMNVVHFADGAEEGEIVESVTENGEAWSAVEFRADGFSVYSIVDAPEPVTEYQNVGTLDEIEENQEYYLSIARSGTNYMTSTSVKNGGTYELKGVTDKAAAEPWLFEFSEDGKVYIYFLDSENTKMYLNVDDSRNISFSESPQPFSIEQTIKNEGTFYIYTVINSKNYALSVRSNRNFFFENRNNGVNNNERVVLTRYLNDPYELDGKTFGIAYNDDSVTAAALSAERGSTQNRLQGVNMLIRTDVLNNNGTLLVAENSDIQEWTFESAGADFYYIKTTAEGAEKYLHINNGNVTLVDGRDGASEIQAIPGTGDNSGKWHFTVRNYSLNYMGNAAGDFNAASNSSATTWLNLVEKSTLSEDDFVSYSARKISASDDILSATEKDENGQIIHDGDGNPVYREDKTQVVIYTRVWNETTKRYEFYALDHDGSLVRVYDSGDKINWVGNQVNSTLWEFTEYTNTDGTPNYFYELENTAYAGTYLVPQSESIISDQPVGINLNGRREGFDYSSIVAWDDDAYAYSGLKVVRGADGSLRVVTCSLDEAADFHFAVITPPVEEASPVTTVATVDNNDFGISIKMIDFNNSIKDGRDSEQTSYLGSRPWNQAQAYEAETGLVSTNLTGGYPTVTTHAGQYGNSLSGLFQGMTPANHLFIQSVYNESGYFEYDSTQNFARFNEDDGTFTVYNQIGAIGSSTGPTRTHGQFMPYNDISSEIGYAHDSQGNVIGNKTNIRSEELPDTDPRKGEPMYSIPQNEADYYFGMELSAVFTQTPDGVDNWGHDIIFEFTGDDDFWFYVDGELVLDLGGVHSALGGSVNFRTGEVVCNGTTTSLYEVFRSNYQARGLNVDKVDELFVTKTVNGETVHVFNDYTTHEMKMFYMERGAGASNLKMRFNLASVKPGTVELSKKLKGIDSASNKLIQYPYQIWYQTVEYQQNEDGSYVLDGNGNRVIERYNDAVLLSQPATNTNLTGKVYAVYKGTKKLIPYKRSMTIGGIPYNNVFLLKAGETAVINFPENTYRYKIVECGVDTAVYEHVFINGDQSENEIFGKPHNNTDGWDPSGGPETPPSVTTTYEGSTRSDFGISFDSTEGRPRVEYTNQVPPEVMRTLSFEKVLYDTTGKRLTDQEAAQSSAEFSFRLYLGNEFAEQENLLPADMYTYYIKDPDHNYCKWDKASKQFVSLGVNTFEGFKGLSEADRDAGTFTTSMYGSISKIPAGYTVEVRDLIVGTKYKIDEPDREVPKGYTRRDSDGYVRTDLAGGPVVYYTEEGTYGRHPEEGNRITAEPISDTIADKTDSPNIEIRNQEGWGLTAKKEWTDKDFFIHDPIYLAVYLDDGHGDPGELIEGSVRRLDTDETEVYWFFPDLKIGEETYRFDKFIVREVELTGTPSVNENTGVVTGYTGITPIAKGGSISVSGRTSSGISRTETYTVDYQTGDSTGQNENIRTDTVTNSRPGIQIYKMDWNGESYLSGAVFTLKDSGGHDVGHASYTSDSKGLVTTAYLNEGTFTLDEIRTPAGYAAPDEPVTIHVTTTAPARYDLTVTVGEITYYITLSGPAGFYTVTPATGSSMARITVKNRTVQELTVVKEGVDGGERTPLSGVHFALYEQVKDSEGNVRPAYSPKSGYEDLVTDETGILEEIKMSVGTGTYYLREKAAPSGYKKLAEDLCFTIGENGTVRIHNAGYSNWLTADTSDPGKISYTISIENTPVGITVRKTDETETSLIGSQFEHCRKNDAGSFEAVNEYGLVDGLIDLTDKAEMTFTGLSNGSYKLSEKVSPSGYLILTSDVYFSVSDGAVTLTDESGGTTTYPEVSLKDENTTIVVKNVPGPALPNTGGPGIKLFTASGAALAAGAGLLLWKRREILCW